MAKFSNDNNMDELLNRIKNNYSKIVLCNGQPANFNEAQTNKGSTVSGGGTARRLGEVNTDGATNITGPADGATSGRRITFDQITGLGIDVTSTGANHVAIVFTTTGGSVGDELGVVTTISSPQDVTQGNTATINAFDLEIADAS